MEYFIIGVVVAGLAFLVYKIVTADSNTAKGSDGQRDVRNKTDYK